MALAYDATQVTRDVDAMFVPHRIVAEEARAVAGELGLPPWWLNETSQRLAKATVSTSAFPHGWHLATGLPGPEARDFLRRRWWHRAQWRRVRNRGIPTARVGMPKVTDAPFPIASPQG